MSTAKQCKQALMDFLSTNPTAVQKAYDPNLNYNSLQCNCGDNVYGNYHNPYEHLYCVDPTTGIEWKLKSLRDLNQVILNKANWRFYGTEQFGLRPGVTHWSFDCEPFDDQLRGYVGVDANNNVVDVYVAGE